MGSHFEDELQVMSALYVIFIEVLLFISLQSNLCSYIAWFLLAIFISSEERHT